MNPNITTINKFLELKERMEELFKEQSAFYDELFKNYGDGIHEVTNPDGGCFKLTVTDNIRKLTDGEDVWKSTKIAPISVSVTKLKRDKK